MSIYNHFSGGFVQRILQSQPKWRYLHFMPSTHSFYRPFLLFSAVLCLFSAIQAQQFEPMRGGNAPMRGDDGGPRANNRGGIRITASGQCVQLQMDDKNLNTAGVAGAIISLGYPTIRHRSEKL
jgi:hypothetical protein